MKVLLLLLLSGPTAQASVATVSVSQDTIAQVADVIAVRRVATGDRSTLKVTIAPPPGMAFLYGDLHAGGWTARLQPEPLETGHVAFTVHVDPDTTSAPALDILLDNIDPNRPAVGVLYQLSLASFLD